jgi:hypothetical protein
MVQKGLVGSRDERAKSNKGKKESKMGGDSGDDTLKKHYKQPIYLILVAFFKRRTLKKSTVYRGKYQQHLIPLPIK